MQNIWNGVNEFFTTIQDRLLPKTEQVSNSLAAVIPQDVLVNILIRALSFKDLVHFNCVCLNWKNASSPLLKQTQEIYTTLLRDPKVYEVLFKTCQPNETPQNALSMIESEFHFIRDKNSQALSFIEAVIYDEFFSPILDEELIQKAEKDLNTVRTASVAQCIIERKRDIAPKTLLERFNNSYASYDWIVTEIRLISASKSDLSLTEAFALQALVQKVMKAIKPVNEQFAERKGPFSKRSGEEI